MQARSQEPLRHLSLTEERYQVTVELAGNVRVFADHIPLLNRIGLEVVKR